MSIEDFRNKLASYFTPFLLVNCCPPEHTKEDIFEQMVSFTLSENYAAIKGLLESLADEVKIIQDVTKMA